VVGRACGGLASVLKQIKTANLLRLAVFIETPMNEIFRKIAHSTSQMIGTPVAFIIAVLVVVVWAVSGPLFGFSDTWQLVINTGTTIVTFLVVFMIQNTQNRDSKAIQLKLDELLRALEPARTGLVDLEDMTDEELEKLADEFHRLREKVQAARSPNTDTTQATILTTESENHR
jgi:low affinity Fe/Cu permease